MSPTMRRAPLPAWLRAVLAALLAGASCLLAAGELEDRVRAALAPPAMILERSDDLRLTLAQRTRVRGLMTRAQESIHRLEVDLLEATGRLVEALEAQPIDRAAAVAELAKVNTAESEIKRIHLQLWIEANADLTTAQRKRVLGWVAEESKTRSE